MREDDAPGENAPSAEDEFEEALRGDEESPERKPGLSDEVLALIADGRTYAEAEFAFQKSRLSYSAQQGKSAAISVLAALAFLHLALIALVVGAVIALTPYLTALGATAAVVGVLLLATLIVLLKARRRARNIADAFSEDEQ
ncbi:phage holin family protein [Altererythrobacter lutimaris]|uniref:Phage holin family protein n=1 Tax=Altererythrobacter lutimaris TaxID=2743979 RepID=A0A850H7A5_9SPHN|nr:phage holin family protein [Altererythrobacter lutimaris]NVE93733.1 phage holin family protein [Altererythrobacter lutimaris]